ncbi:MarR family transcriptional regulator [Amycolatopsis sp. PS_44_ISF1]|uniref:MarR family winged helix-turn-helix transcriptional regulator n=1 Tax=Amycolatopsis sp. PS_44_ISF1 TaxID=2974917 RepID=UPI0028DE401C|nr:MarR family transcriptional regulator [Amycolatopsis sp. PS_44_ISF1]MDT8914149.1 MarR family transcriptional regulator [Amycolatopsis sp. PS_44_ISF1]
MSDPAAVRAWARMRSLVLEQHDRRRAVGDALGLSFVKVKALYRLAEAPMTMGELTGWLATDPPYTTLVVDDLVGRGLAVREPHPGDRRSRVVTLTPAGCAAAELALGILEEPPAAMLALPPGELAALDRVLARLTGRGVSGS